MDNQNTDNNVVVESSESKLENNTKKLSFGGFFSKFFKKGVTESTPAVKTEAPKNESEEFDPKRLENKVSLSPNIEDKIELIIEGDELAATYTMAIFKNYIETRRNELNKDSLNEAPFSVDGHNEGLLCLLIPEQLENTVVKTLISYGVAFVEARDDFGGGYVLLLMHEIKAAERVFIDKNIEKPLYCFLSSYDIGLDGNNPTIDDTSVNIGIRRGVGVDGVFDPKLYVQEIISMTQYIQRLYLSSTLEERISMGTFYRTPEAIIQEDEEIQMLEILQEMSEESGSPSEVDEALAYLEPFVEESKNFINEAMLQKWKYVGYFQQRTTEEIKAEQDVVNDMINNDGVTPEDIINSFST